MTQVIKTENPDNSATNAILMVLVLAAIVAFGIWFFGQAAIPAANTEAPGLNVDVNLPTGGNQNTNGGTPAPATNQ